MFANKARELYQSFEHSTDRTTNAGRCWKVTERLPSLWQGVRYTHYSHIARAPLGTA